MIDLLLLLALLMQVGGAPSGEATRLFTIAVLMAVFLFALLAPIWMILRAARPLLVSGLEKMERIASQLRSLEKLDSLERDFKVLLRVNRKILEDVEAYRRELAVHDRRTIEERKQ